MNFTNIHKINKYQISSTEMVNIFSMDGMFSIDQKHIYKLNIVDDQNTHTITVNGYDIVVDNTTITREIVNQIPADHLAIPTNIQRFMMRPKSSITLVIEQSYGTMSNMYFETNVNDLSTNDDVNMFLSLLN